MCNPVNIRLLFTRASAHEGHFVFRLQGMGKFKARHNAKVLVTNFFKDRDMFSHNFF